MIHGIIICHGDLAASLIATVERILGPNEGIAALSNSGLAPDGLYQQVTDVMQEWQTTEVVMMVDMRGGSCWSVACMLKREHPHIKVVSGINLPMLISFLTKRQNHDYPQLIEILASDAGKGVVVD